MVPKEIPHGLTHRHVHDVQEEKMELIADNIKELAKHVHPPVPNPAPLGLLGFGLTTCLLQMKHTKITGDSGDEMKGVDTVTLGFAMFFGGLLQVSQIIPMRGFSVALLARPEPNSVFLSFLFIPATIFSDHRWYFGDKTEQHLRIHGLLHLRRFLDVLRHDEYCSPPRNGRRKRALQPPRSPGDAVYAWRYNFHVLGPHVQAQQDNMFIVLPTRHYLHSPLVRSSEPDSRYGWRLFWNFNKCKRFLARIR